MGHMDFYKVLEAWGTHGYSRVLTVTERTGRCTRPAVRTRACSRLPFRFRTATHSLTHGLAWLGSQLAVTMGFEVKCVPPMPQGSTEVRPPARTRWVGT